MNLREALIVQNPSLELQRAAQAEIARLDSVLKDLAARYYEAQAELAQASNTIAIYKDRFGPLTQELA